jgi:hypothetical protein
MSCGCLGFDSELCGRRRHLNNRCSAIRPLILPIGQRPMLTDPDATHHFFPCGAQLDRVPALLLHHCVLPFCNCSPSIDRVDPQFNNPYPAYSSFFARFVLSNEFSRHSDAFQTLLRRFSFLGETIRCMGLSTRNSSEPLHTNCQLDRTSTHIFALEVCSTISGMFDHAHLK